LDTKLYVKHSLSVLCLVSAIVFDTGLLYVIEGLFRRFTLAGALVPEQIRAAGRHLGSSEDWPIREIAGSDFPRVFGLGSSMVARYVVFLAAPVAALALGHLMIAFSPCTRWRRLEKISLALVYGGVGVIATVVSLEPVLAVWRSFAFAPEMALMPILWGVSYLCFLICYSVITGRPMFKRRLMSRSFIFALYLNLGVFLMAFTLKGLMLWRRAALLF